MISHEPLPSEFFQGPPIPPIPASEGDATSSDKAAQRASRVSTATTVRTPSKRRKNRNDALARLEGRVREAKKALDRELKSDRVREQNIVDGVGEIFREVDDDDDDYDRDFMFMSDDESEETHMQSLAPPPTPIPIAPMPISARISDVNVGPARAVQGRRRRSTMESWFPLSNFMDLRDDRDGCESGSSGGRGSAGWRSVVGVVTT